jgi:hypothetical protein
MPKTVKAKRSARKKVLTRKMKEQTRNAAKVAKRIARIKKELWELELDEFRETGLLQQLTWTYEDRVRLLGCSAIGFMSTETTLDSKVVRKIQKWFWEHREERRDDVGFFTKSIDGYRINLALQMDWTDDEECYNEGTDPQCVTIFAIDVEETGTGHPAEKKALKAFAEKWDIEATIDA